MIFRFLENFCGVLSFFIVGMLVVCAFATPTILTHILFGTVPALIMLVLTTAAAVAAVLTFDNP